MKATLQHNHPMGKTIKEVDVSINTNKTTLIPARMENILFFQNVGSIRNVTRKIANAPKGYNIASKRGKLKVNWSTKILITKYIRMYTNPNPKAILILPKSSRRFLMPVGRNCRISWSAAYIIARFSPIIQKDKGLSIKLIKTKLKNNTLLILSPNVCF